MILTRFLRRLQGERPGMGSELVMPDKRQESLAFYSPTIAIQQAVQIADVSFYQGAIDWALMAEQLDGVIIRAGQRTWVDSKFTENWKGAKAAGIPCGTYWFYDSREPPEKQAALWWSLIKDDPGELIHAADFEESYGGPYGSVTHFRQFVSEFQRLSGLPDDRIAIYTAYYWWYDRTGGDSWFIKYWLWLAWYAAMDIVRIPPPWVSSDLLIWQYTSSGDGKSCGVSSLEIDLNWYCCDLATYQNQFHLNQPTNGDVSMSKYEATSNFNMSRRAAPTVDNAPLSSIPAGSKMHGDVLVGTQGSGECWLCLTDVNGVPTTGYVAIEHNGTVYCKLVETTTPSTGYVDVPYSYVITLGGQGSIYLEETIAGSGTIKVKAS